MWFRRHRPAVEPDFGPDIERFRDGLTMLQRDGQTVGHVATSLGHFRTPFSPRKPQAWAWLLVVWADGTKERAVEDYPPWTYVTELCQGYFDWEGGRDRDRAGRYDIEWALGADGDRARAARHSQGGLLGRRRARLFLHLCADARGLGPSVGPYWPPATPVPRGSIALPCLGGIWMRGTSDDGTVLGHSAPQITLFTLGLDGSTPTCEVCVE